MDALLFYRSNKKDLKGQSVGFNYKGKTDERKSLDGSPWLKEVS